MKGPTSLPFEWFTAGRIVRFAVAAVILSVGWLILSPYRHYVPADLTRGFLRNKADFFYSSSYFLGFYAHILTVPAALLCGTLQMSRTLRLRCPQVHRRLGQTYVFLVLCFAAPGGLVMATRAWGGPSSVVCFSAIALLSWIFTAIGWHRARQGRYLSHGRWMGRSYVMMCSAIVLRLADYLLLPFGLDPVVTYRLAAWLSWVPPLILFESAIRYRNPIAPSPPPPPSPSRPAMAGNAIKDGR